MTHTILIIDDVWQYVHVFLNCNQPDKDNLFSRMWRTYDNIYEINLDILWQEYTNRNKL